MRLLAGSTVHAVRSQQLQRFWREPFIARPGVDADHRLGRRRRRRRRRRSRAPVRRPHVTDGQRLAGRNDGRPQPAEQIGRPAPEDRPAPRSRRARPDSSARPEAARPICSVCPGCTRNDGVLIHRAPVDRHGRRCSRHGDDGPRLRPAAGPARCRWFPAPRRPPDCRRDGSPAGRPERRESPTAARRDGRARDGRRPARSSAGRRPPPRRRPSWRRDEAHAGAGSDQRRRLPGGVEDDGVGRAEQVPAAGARPRIDGAVARRRSRPNRAAPAAAGCCAGAAAAPGRGRTGTRSPGRSR